MVVISDDLRSNTECRIRTVAYTVDSKPVTVYVISDVFCGSHGIQEGVYELLDDFPSWIHELRPICEKCLTTLHKGNLTPEFKWVYDDDEHN